MTVEGPKRQPWPRWAVLSWMASLCAAARMTDMAEGYALELVSTAGHGWSWRA